MITENDYLKAKKVVQEYESKQLNISDVRKRIIIDPDKVIKSNPRMIKQGWGNLF